MNVKKIYAVYFSPTKGTKAYIEGIAKRLAEDFETIDLTIPENRNKEYHFQNNDLIIMGAPVYAGRLPQTEKSIFSCLHGSDTPAVFNVSYGNRDYDDALLEEKELLENQGFYGIAAAAWIAPHTFTDKLGGGRPDAEDEKNMDLFAEKVQAAVSSFTTQKPDIKIKGSHPYKEPGGPMPFHPETLSGCVNCGICAAVCPTAAIDKNNAQIMDADQCINCLACVKACPTGARTVNSPALQAVAQRLEKAFAEPRKKAEFFFS